MTHFQEVTQSLNPGELISLFRLDASKVGGNVMYFVQGAEADGVIKYDGVAYTPVDCEFDGLEVSGQGALPTPKFRLSNTDGLAQQVLNTWGDLLGCELRRIRTYKRFLDGQPDADATAFYGADVFLVERKSSENPIFIEWELSAAVDQEGKKLPGRQVIRDTCLWRYRVWNESSGTFEYAKAQCPYTGENCFDKEGLPVTPDKDRCGRKLSDCKLRFGENNPLPFGGFPGVARVRA